MAREFTIVNVWLGNFRAESDLTAYLAESYSDDGDDKPMSMFASDQDQWFYDHDFVEHAFFERTIDLALTLSRCSFARSYIDDVVAAYKASGLPAVNSALLVFGAAIRDPKPASSDTYQLAHLGRFRCGPST